MPQHSFLSDRIKYRLLLATLVGFILFSPLTADKSYGELFYGLLFLLMMLGVSLNISSPKHAYIALPLLGILTIGFGFIKSDMLYFAVLSKVFALAFFSYAIVIFGRNIFTDYHINIDRIYGAICVYLLIGIAYASVYMLLHTLSPPALIFQQSGKIVTDPFDFYYFSFITLTTVGFGDIIPNNDISKAIIMLEAITGLFYLAVLVASLTGILKKLTAR